MMPDASATVPSIAAVQSSEWLRTGHRAGRPFAEVAANLGLLTEFQGSWRGTGFNITARPFFGSTPPFFLELNATQETLDFTAITGDIPNRGSRQPDINLAGLRYLQQVTDLATNSGIHIEPGLWLRVPATTSPPAEETYVRHATIPARRFAAGAKCLRRSPHRISDHRPCRFHTVQGQRHSRTDQEAHRTDHRTRLSRAIPRRRAATPSVCRRDWMPPRRSRTRPGCCVPRSKGKPSSAPSR